MSDHGRTSLLKYTLAGSIGCVGAGMFVCPQENVKLMMKKDPEKYSSILKTVQEIHKADKFGGFFKGGGKYISSKFPFFALSFFGYGIGKNFVQKMTKRDDLSRFGLLSAGSLAGFVKASYLAASERATDLLTLQKEKPYPEYIGPVHALKEQFKEGGIRKVYWGGMSTFIRDIPTCAMYFTSYELMRRRFRKPDEKKSVVGFWRTVTCGAVAGIVLWLVATPGDTLKETMRVSPGLYIKLGPALKEIMKRGGPFGFYRGKIYLLIRAIPAHAGGFVTFEYIRKFLNHELPSW